MDLQITDGVTTISLTSTDAYLRRYVPAVPEIDTREATRAGTDGADVYGVTYRNVTEQASIGWEGTLTQARETLQTLNQMFEAARHVNRTGMGRRLWVEYRLEDDEDWYRSEILAGRAIIDESGVDYDVQLATDVIEMVVFWQRRHFWEYAADAIGDRDPLEVPLNGAPGGAAITNDAGNTLDIDDDDVIGDLPAPLRLEISNTDASTPRHYTVHVAQNVHSAPATYSHHHAGGTTAAVGATETLLYTWTLTSTALDALAGNVARLMLLMSSYWPNTLWLRWSIYWSLTRLWESGWMQMRGIGLKDMAAAPIPPKIVRGAEDASALELRLYGRDVYNPGQQYVITWLQILPLDGWRVLTPAGYGLWEDGRVVDDAIEGEIWADSGDATAYTPHYTARGNPIMVRPGMDQRLYVVVSTDTGTSVDGRTSTVQAYYRPRRLLL